MNQTKLALQNLFVEFTPVKIKKIEDGELKTEGEKVIYNSKFWILSFKL